MAEQVLQLLTQAISENSHFHGQNARAMNDTNACMAQCANKLNEHLDNLEFGEVEHKEKISSHIRTFYGNPKQFDLWIKELEKYAFLAHLGDQRKQLLAYQYSTGTVRDYIKCYLDSDAQKSWQKLQENLSSRFSAMVDKPKAFELLINMKQRRDEDIQCYAERLLGIAEKAYPEQNDHTKPIIESQILSVFLSGIWDRDIRAQVERNSPNTFEEAYQLALREQQILYRCATRKPNRPDQYSAREKTGESRSQWK